MRVVIGGTEALIGHRCIERPREGVENRWRGGKMRQRIEEKWRGVQGKEEAC